jgi:hypothetical protein
MTNLKKWGIVLALLVAAYIAAFIFQTRAVSGPDTASSAPGDVAAYNDWQIVQNVILVAGLGWAFVLPSILYVVHNFHVVRKNEESE